MNDSILSLLRKIQRLAQDPNAPAGERAAAADKLDALMKRHGLTPADLADSTLTECLIIPPPRTTQENDLILHIIATILNKGVFQYNAIKKRIVSVNLTPVQKADIMDCWLHSLSLLRKALEDSQAEAARLRAEAAALAEQARKEAAAIPDRLTLAFLNRYQLFPEDKTAATSPPLDPAELARLIRMMQGIQGPAWQKKAGALPDEHLRLL